MTAGGESEDQAEVFGRIFAALGIAVMLMYLILVMQFGSFLEPLAIMISLPLSLIGVMLALMFTGRPYIVGAQALTDSAGGERTAARGVEPFRTVLLRQSQNAQARAIALLGMGPALEQGLDERFGVAPAHGQGQREGHQRRDRDIEDAQQVEIDASDVEHGAYHLCKTFGSAQQGRAANIPARVSERTQAGLTSPSNSAASSPAC